MGKTNLFTPNFFRNFLDECKLCPLLRFGELVAYLAGGKSALRTEVQPVQRNYLRSLADTADYGLLVLQLPVR